MGEGGRVRTANGITQRPDPIYCLAYLFHKKLRLPIINVKPIAIIKNHEINETMYENLANEHFRMSQMNRKLV